jgi:hypothetical protein
VNKVLRTSVLAFLVLSSALSLSITVSRVSAFPVVVIPSWATVKPCDSAGNSKKTFGALDSVYASGDGYVAGEDMILRVVPDKLVYIAANSIRDLSIKADGSGHFGPINLGTLAPGSYDLWVDRNGDGWQTGAEPQEPVAGFGYCVTGLLVVPEYLFGTISGLAGCFGAYGMFRVAKRKRKIV